VYYYVDKNVYYIYILNFKFAQKLILMSPGQVMLLRMNKAKKAKCSAGVAKKPRHFGGAEYPTAPGLAKCRAGAAKKASPLWWNRI
jgi:hypothetical protein